MEMRLAEKNTFAVPFPYVPPPNGVRPRRRRTKFLHSYNPRLSSLRLRLPPNIKMIRATESKEMHTELEAFHGMCRSDEPVEFSETRTLPPALTLRHGMTAIREAIAGLKSNPPSWRSGILRYQVAIPPGIDALEWFRCQSTQLNVHPQIFFSKRNADNSNQEFDSDNNINEVCGIGAAAYFEGPSLQEGWSMMKRSGFFTIDSIPIRAYGCPGVDPKKEPSNARKKINSFYLFIPQIELLVFENFSLLAATMAWDEQWHNSFHKSLISLEEVLCQVQESSGVVQQPLQADFTTPQILGQAAATKDRDNGQWIHDYQEKLYFAGEDSIRMVYPSNYHQFYVRLSASVVFARNMFDISVGFGTALKKSLNINMAWAYLIVEECCRLGLTYFCIAPGSRSSPLALAATSHSKAICISSYDERSLAFHAVGYAKGSRKPAVVITSSGTAVSNLLPAVVEASQDFVPLVLLTADRPPELLDNGANQTINQVNHFGSFVRFFFNLPPPSDQVLARLVLTTVDSAVHYATTTFGPVHINCGFREPLDNSPWNWDMNCLLGLDLWLNTCNPFTKYIRVSATSERTHGCNIVDQLKEIVDIIQGASRGLLVIGAIHGEEDIWAVLLLCRHLQWAVVPDILSGLRVRKSLVSDLANDVDALFIDYLDHALLSESTRALVKPDVVIQVGSRLTSKRVLGMLETCNPHSYIMVDKHGGRHDPSHLVTHRIQSTVPEFADVILASVHPNEKNSWTILLHRLNEMVAWELSFQILSHDALTEPFAAYLISEGLCDDDALFVGNSMVIRDLNMYASASVKSDHGGAEGKWNCRVSCTGIRVLGNRGASGIDGLLSTGIGFAAGSQKRVAVVVGDVSFLHDTNGLAMLNQRTCRKPITIIVINNGGGAIFSMLPIAKSTPSNILEKYFYTKHRVEISKLCEAHGVQHVRVQTKKELAHALSTLPQQTQDRVIEVKSSIDSNATFHSYLQQSACQVAEDAVAIFSRIPYRDIMMSNSTPWTVQNMKFSLYRIKLQKPPTSAKTNESSDEFWKEGFILELHLEDGSIGVGEVAPIEIHKENILDAEEQLSFLCHRIQGAKISCFLPLMEGTFSLWIWRTLGIQPSTIFSSVRCGLEMAILNAIAAASSTSMFGAIMAGKVMETSRRENVDKADHLSSMVHTCALLDSNGSAAAVALLVSQLIDLGFKTVKLKVARRVNPLEDASIIQELRQKIGYQLNIRVDANRRWTYSEAVQFALHVKNLHLEFIEEPVQHEDDIIRFCDECNLPVALDETIDSIQGDPIEKLSTFTHPGVVALVIKPSRIGGFENSALIAKWAHVHNKMAIISGAFESSISLCSFVQFASYLDIQNSRILRWKEIQSHSDIVHGLGTYQWLKDDMILEPLQFTVQPDGNSVEASVDDAIRILRNCKINREMIQRSYVDSLSISYRLNIEYYNRILGRFQIHDTGVGKEEDEDIFFLHGFLGTGEDWMPIMKAISSSRRCISIDLPGHGKSQLLTRNGGSEECQRTHVSFEAFMDMLLHLIHKITPRKVTLVGYSMGARMALYMALRCSQKVSRAILISGSPGMQDLDMRKLRITQDDVRADHLVTNGIHSFLETWYSAELWKSLRNHPLFEEIRTTRMKHDNLKALAESLSSFSVGRQPPLWDELKHCNIPLLFIVGKKDKKFLNIAKQMHDEISKSPLVQKTSDVDQSGDRKLCEVLEVPDCGHAVHLENPLPVISAIRRFATGLELMD